MDGLIFWIDVVGEGQNENAIFARPFDVKEAIPQQLTSKKYNIKNNFHGYGGKSYKCINFKNNFYFMDRSDYQVSMVSNFQRSSVK